MKLVLKKVLLILCIAFAAIIFGQFYFNGRPIAERISSLVNQPKQFEILEDSGASASYYGKIMGKKIPIYWNYARQKVATWIYPSVTTDKQSPRN